MGKDKKRGMSTTKAKALVLGDAEDLTGLKTSDLYRLLYRLSHVVRRWKSLRQIPYKEKYLRKGLLLTRPSNIYLIFLRAIDDGQSDSRRLSVWAEVCSELERRGIKDEVSFLSVLIDEGVKGVLAKARSVRSRSSRTT